VSPSLVGTVVAVGGTQLGGSSQAINDGIQTLVGPDGCADPDAGCAVGLKIPRDFTGQATIYVGRPAQPGETYDSANSAFAPGEALHCSGLLGTQVSTALPKLARYNVTVEWAHTDAANNTTVDQTPPPATYYVWNATPTAPGTVTIDARPTPPSADLVAAGRTHFDQGCSGP
jgi:hypothetical protein